MPNISIYIGVRSSGQAKHGGHGISPELLRFQSPLRGFYVTYKNERPRRKEALVCFILLA